MNQIQRIVLYQNFASKTYGHTLNVVAEGQNTTIATATVITLLLTLEIGQASVQHTGDNGRPRL